MAMQIEVCAAIGRWDDFASFMVPSKPGGQGCVCMVYRNSSLDMPGRIAHMRDLCAGDPGPGVLAYVDGEVAGWCSVGPKSTHRALLNSRTIPRIDDEDVWSVVCFVVRTGFRRLGLMHRLLDGAIEHAHAMGAPALEGYPVDPSRVTYFIGRETVVRRTDGRGLPWPVVVVFSFMLRNSSETIDYFHLPRDEVVEIGRQFAI